MKTRTIIRLILSAVIIYFIYKETGTATTIFAITVTIAIELQSKVQNMQRKYNDTVCEYIESKDSPKSESDETMNQKKSRWQQRLEEIQKMQQQQKAKRDKL